MGEPLKHHPFPKEMFLSCFSNKDSPHQGQANYGIAGRGSKRANVSIRHQIQDFQTDLKLIFISSKKVYSSIHSAQRLSGICVTVAIFGTELEGGKRDVLYDKKSLFYSERASLKTLQVPPNTLQKPLGTAQKVQTRSAPGDPFFGSEAEQREGEIRHLCSPSSTLSSPHHLDTCPGAGLGRLGGPGAEFRGELSGPRAQHGRSFPSRPRRLEAPARQGGSAQCDAPRRRGGQCACASRPAAGPVCDQLRGGRLCQAAVRMRQPPGGRTAGQPARGNSAHA